MRCPRRNLFENLICRRILLAVALVFPASSFGQQSLHLIQFDAGSGFARTPMQSSGTPLCWSSATSLKGWGHERIGHNALHWRGALGLEAYSGQPEVNQSRLEAHIGMRRFLKEHVETGLEVNASKGTEWDRSLRFQEEWRVFYTANWGGKWWMSLRQAGRSCRIYIEKNEWSYASNVGFDRREFDVGTEVRIPIMTRVRGQVRLNRIRQRRTHHLADLVVELSHQETQFRNWMLREGPVGSGLEMRYAAHTDAGQGWQGYRLWTETEGTLRLEISEHFGLRGGVDLGWMHRVDAVRGAYDEDRALVGTWIAGAHAKWAGKARCTWNAVHSSGQTIYSERGWDTYRYTHTSCEGRLERTIRGDMGLFVAGGFQLWRSNALPVGWYQRSDWSSGWMRCGLVWQASTAPRWERRQPFKRRMAFE